MRKKLIKDDIIAIDYTMRSIVFIALLVACYAFFNYFCDITDKGVVLDKRPFITTSGSMLPNIEVNSISMTHRFKGVVNVGDVVVYMSPTKGRVIHRVISLGADTLVTQGDNNENPDKPIQYSQILYVVDTVYNEISPMISKLLVDVTTTEGVLRFLVLAFVFSAVFALVVVVLYFIFDFTVINSLLGRRGNIQRSMYWENHRVTSSDLEGLLEARNKSSFFKRIILMYFIVKVYNALREEEKMAHASAKMHARAIKLVGKECSDELV